MTLHSIRRVIAVLFVLIAALMPVDGLSAQVEGTASVAVNSQYQARGITTTNRGVIQPDVAITVPAGRTTFLAGAFASYEGGRYDDPSRHISENGGERLGIAEYSFRLEASREIGRASLTLGATNYAFPNELGTTAAANTAEIYARLTGRGRLAPSIAVWHDVQKVAGSYAELAIAPAFGPLAFALVSGWNLGQSMTDGGSVGYFDRHGLTHVEASVSMDVSAGGVTFTPTAHVILGVDPLTRITAPGAARTTKLWIGSTVKWVGRAAR